jgi:hypothetical protein
MALTDRQVEELDHATCPNLGDAALGTIIRELQLDAILANANVDDSTVYVTVGGLLAVKPGGLVAASLAAGAVTTAKILDANVTHAKLAADAVEADNIATGAVVADGLGAKAVDTPAIADAAVENLQLGADAVEADNIADGAVGAAALAAGAVLSIRHRVSAAEVDAGHALVTPPAGMALRLVDCALIAIGGGAAGATTVDILDGATKLVAAAVAGLTQSALLRAGAANAVVLADGASFVARAADAVISIGKTGDALTGCTYVDVLLSYAIA